MFKNYIKIALKGLLRKKYYTVISLFGIIITLIVLTVAVAIMNHSATLGKSGSRLDRCLIVNRIEAIFNRGHIISSPSYYILDQYVRNMKTAEAISVFSESQEVVIYAEHGRIPASIKHTDEAFWDITEFPFLNGWAFGKDALDKAEMVAVITDRAEKKIFGTKPALGKYLETSLGTFRVMGVIPYKEIGAMPLNADLYVPITTSIGKMNNRKLWGAEMALVQAFDKAQFASIKAEFQEHINQLAKDYNDELQIVSLDVFIGSMSESVANAINQSEIVYLLGVIGLMVLFMLLPAINLTTINVSRIMERFSEIGIRKAFGASSSVLMGQFILENVILTLIGGLLAYIISGMILQLMNNSGVVPWGYMRLDLTIFFYSMVVTIFFGVLSGILPSYRMSRLHPAEALKGIKR